MPAVPSTEGVPPSTSHQRIPRCAGCSNPGGWPRGRRFVSVGRDAAYLSIDSPSTSGLVLLRALLAPHSMGRATAHFFPPSARRA
jgi:hypothetical protein